MKLFFCFCFKFFFVFLRILLHWSRRFVITGGLRSRGVHSSAIIVQFCGSVAHSNRCVACCLLLIFHLRLPTWTFRCRGVPNDFPVLTRRVRPVYFIRVVVLRLGVFVVLRRVTRRRGTGTRHDLHLFVVLLRGVKAFSLALRAASCVYGMAVVFLLVVAPVVVLVG